MTTIQRHAGALTCVRGVVVLGDQRGRTLGFPTANVVMNAEAQDRGVFAAIVHLADGTSWNAAVNIGRHPTVGEADETLLEAHLLDFDGDLYHQEIEVQLVSWLRAERRMASLEALVEQLTLDVQQVRAVLADLGPTVNP